MTPEQKRRKLELLQMQGRATQQEPRQTLWDMVVENVVGRGEVDTPGERAGEIIGDTATAFGRGLLRGGAELVGLPGTIERGITRLANRTANRVGLLSDEGLAYEAPDVLSGAALRGGLSAITGGASEQRGDTRAERVAGTVGEFAPLAMTGGPARFLGWAVAPGTASELAGEATEGTAAEPYARAAAAVGTSLLTGGTKAPRLGAVGADDTAQSLAKNLREAGVTPTAGQVTGSGVLRGMEGTVSPTARQIDDFTAAAMRTIGSEAPKATRGALATAQKSITTAMDDALAGVSFKPTQAMAQQADDLVTRYKEMAPAMAVVPRARGIADEIIEAATSPQAQAIDLSLLRQWRSALGKMTTSNDEATRDVAVGLRRLIDDATDTALQGAGRADDLANLAREREKYRNFIAVRDAATRAGAEAGTLSPTQLNASVMRTQGREAVAVGRGTNLEELSRGGAAMLRPAPTVEAGGVRRLPPELQTGGLGGLLGFAAGGPPGAVAGASAGAASVPLLQMGMRSNSIQALLNDPAYAALSTALRTSPGVLAGSR